MTPRLRTEVEREMSVPQSETELGREMDEQIVLEAMMISLVLSSLSLSLFCVIQTLSSETQA